MVPNDEGPGHKERIDGWYDVPLQKFRVYLMGQVERFIRKIMHQDLGHGANHHVIELGRSSGVEGEGVVAGGKVPHGLAGVAFPVLEDQDV